MTEISDLIAAKEKQVVALQKQIELLRQVEAAEADNGADGVGRRRRGRIGVAPGKRARRGRRGQSRAALIEVYLQQHPGPQPAKEIAAALGMKAAELHSAINPGLKTARFTRGEERGSYTLGGIVSKSTQRKHPRRRRTPSKKRKTAAAAKTGARKKKASSVAEAAQAE